MELSYGESGYRADYARGINAKGVSERRGDKGIAPATEAAQRVEAKRMKFGSVPCVKTSPFFLYYINRMGGCHGCPEGEPRRKGGALAWYGNGLLIWP